jgi:hypothetical protein
MREWFWDPARPRGSLEAHSECQVRQRNLLFYSDLQTHLQNPIRYTPSTYDSIR